MFYWFLAICIVGVLLTVAISFWYRRSEENDSSITGLTVGGISILVLAAFGLAFLLSFRYPGFVSKYSIWNNGAVKCLTTAGECYDTCKYEKSKKIGKIPVLTTKCNKNYMGRDMFYILAHLIYGTQKEYQKILDDIKANLNALTEDEMKYMGAKDTVKVEKKYIDITSTPRFERYYLIKPLTKVLDITVIVYFELHGIILKFSKGEVEQIEESEVNDLEKDFFLESYVKLFVDSRDRYESFKLVE